METFEKKTVRTMDPVTGAETEFTLTFLEPCLIQIENEVNNCATLVVGEKKAILFDTMCGIGDLRQTVEEVTDLPLTVINSHAHYDHMGGNYQFDSVYMNEVDRFILDTTYPILEEIETNMKKDLSAARKSFSPEAREKLKDIKPGWRIDLGGISAETIDMTGHTPGSIGLMLKGDKLKSSYLLAGDAISPQMCLFFPDSLPVEVYRETLEKIMKMEFDYFIQAHFSTRYPHRILEKFRECSLLPMKKKGMAYVNSHIPEYKGKLYLYALRDPEIDCMICLIDKV